MRTAWLVMLIVLAIILLPSIIAEPSGTSISDASTSQRVNDTAANRTDTGGTITTMVISSIQQNTNWKAYVGNISGSLTLDDAQNKTIYDWSIVSLAGELYVSRVDSVTWSSLNCSLDANVTSEESLLGFASSDSDNINRTFNETTHRSFLTGTRNISGCKSKALYVNDSAQAVAMPSATFQEIVGFDGTNTVFVSLLENDGQGYDNETTFDFQIIVPQNKSTGTATPYYFWVELG
ncbi:MAG: hypothetical protein V1725_03620 [archaeon]